MLAGACAVDACDGRRMCCGRVCWWMCVLIDVCSWTCVLMDACADGHVCRKLHTATSGLHVGNQPKVLLSNTME